MATQHVPQIGSWASSPRGRRELTVCALFCLGHLLIPVVLHELYPFSIAPMFEDAPRVYCRYEVHRPDGTGLPLTDFGLQRNYWGNPLTFGMGIRPAFTIDRFGCVAEPKEVTAQVQRALAHRSELAYVDLVQEVIGAKDSLTVGALRRSEWRVFSPLHPQIGRP